MYSYLTGAASWLMMTMISEVFGVRGEAGNLILHPRLLAEQFDQTGTASITIPFAGKMLEIIYKNPDGRDFGSYIIGSASCDGTALTVNEEAFILLLRQQLTALPGDQHTIIITLQGGCVNS